MVIFDHSIKCFDMMVSFWWDISIYIKPVKKL